MAEAEDAGRPIKERLIMKYFLEQLKEEEDLKDWLAEEKFKSLEYTVRRLTRKLKAHEGWLKGKAAPNSPANSEGNVRDGQSTPSRGRVAPRGGRVNATTGSGENGPAENEDFVVSVASAVEVALKKPLEALVNLMQANETARLNAQQAPSVPTVSPGDRSRVSFAPAGERGENWHVPSEHVVCYKTPCNAKFCQKCGKHGHVRAECKVPDSEPRANKHGYWCEQKKGEELKPIYREHRGAPGTSGSPSSYRFGGPPSGSGRQAARTNATQTAGGQCL